MTFGKSPVGRLVIERTSQTMAAGGAGSALQRLADGQLVDHAKEARAWVAAAVLAVRQAPGDNHWRDATDDEIAQTILGKITEKRGTK